MAVLEVFSKKKSSFIGVIFIISLLFLLSACGSNSPAAGGAEEPAKTGDKTEETKKAVEELSEKEAKKIVAESMAGIVEIFVNGREHYNNVDNPADFSVMRPQLIKYASEKFTDGFLKETAANYYCECDYRFFPDTNLDVRFTLDEHTDGKFTASSIEFINDMGDGGNIVKYSVIQENGKWVMDDIEWVSYEEEALNVTWEEVKAYEEQYGLKVELLNETEHNGRKVYIINMPENEHIMGIYADNTQPLYEVPNELLPKSMQKLTPEEAEKMVKERLGFANRPEVSANYDHDSEEGYYSIQLYKIQDKGTPYERVATYGWYDVDPVTGDIYDAVLGGKVE